MPYDVRLSSRYEVSIATKKDSEFLTAVDWFYRNFDLTNESYFLFNEEIINDISYGDSVNYVLTEISDVPRSDGVIEALFIFELKYWAAIKPVKAHMSLFEAIKIEFNDVITLPNAPNSNLLGITVIENV